MQGEERHYYCMYVWEDVWPLSLASSPAPHVTHQLGPNVDQDRKTIKMKQNVNKRKQVLMLLGCCFPLCNIPVQILRSCKHTLDPECWDT